jgi:hypothetical protein
MSAHLAVDPDKGLVGVLVFVPDELAPKFPQLGMVVVHLRDDFRRPYLRNLAQFRLRIDRLRFHAQPRNFDDVLRHNAASSLITQGKEI